MPASKLNPIATEEFALPRPTSVVVIAAFATAMLLAPTTSSAHGEDGIAAPVSEDVVADFDIIHARITTDGRIATFHMGLTGTAGGSVPAVTGDAAGSQTYAYVWPTTIDPFEVGFESGAGILALAVTSHPDFDDTPLFDENRDSDFGNDGGAWHSHWVVLGPDDACGPGAFKVVDIPDGTQPRLPATWPGFPILLDSPGWQPAIGSDTVDIQVAFDDIAIVDEANFDGVTAGLRVNQNLHAPFFCVVDVFDVASGDLSLPGAVNN